MPLPTGSPRSSKVRFICSNGHQCDTRLAGLAQGGKLFDPFNDGMVGLDGLRIIDEPEVHPGDNVIVSTNPNSAQVSRPIAARRSGALAHRKSAFGPPVKPGGHEPPGRIQSRSVQRCNRQLESRDWLDFPERCKPDISGHPAKVPARSGALAARNGIVSVRVADGTHVLAWAMG